MFILFSTHCQSHPDWSQAPRNSWKLILSIDHNDFMLRWSAQLFLAAENELIVCGASLECWMLPQEYYCTVACTIVLVLYSGSESKLQRLQK